MSSTGEALIGLLTTFQTFLVTWTGWGLEVVALTVVLFLILAAVNEKVLKPRRKQQTFWRNYGGIGVRGQSTKKQQ